MFGPKKLTKQRALTAIQSSPKTCLLTKEGKPFDWRERGPRDEVTNTALLDDVYVVVDGHEIGWMRTARYDYSEKAIVIGHLGITKSYVGAGIGQAVAFALRDILMREVKETRVIFDESHADEMDLYLKFFKRIGARQTKPDTDPLYWVWDFPAAAAQVVPSAPTP